MVLKSYSLFPNKKRNKPKKRRGSIARDLIVGGTGAIIGIGFLGATTEAVGRI